jgi:hypothetical protein
MAYKITLEARQTGTGVVDVDVPAEVASDLKETYEALRETPKVLAHGVFDNLAEKETFVAQAKTWARQNGLEFRVSPMRNFPVNELRFNIRLPKDAGQDTEPRHVGQ